MSAVRIAGFAAASILVGAIGFAQSNSKQTSSEKHIAKADMTTVVGCLMKETDYRAAHGFGKGIFGGAGLGDEYVLVDAAVMPNASTSTSSTNSSTPAASSTSSASASPACSDNGNGVAYRTTGPREKSMQSLLGQRVEVTGKLRHPVTRKNELPQEIVVASFIPAPAPVSEQAAAAPAPATPAPAPALEAQNNTPAPAPEKPPAASNHEQPVGTSGKLPKTAGEEPLIGLIGLLSLGAGISLKMLRRATAA